MDSDSINYIDGKFKELNNTLRTAVTIAVTILIALITSIGLNMRVAYANKHSIEILKTKQDETSYMMGWSIELAEIQRDYIKALSKDEDVSMFLDKLEDIEKRIYGVNGQPAFRGGN